MMNLDHGHDVRSIGGFLNTVVARCQLEVVKVKKAKQNIKAIIPHSSFIAESKHFSTPDINLREQKLHTELRLL